MLREEFLSREKNAAFFLILLSLLLILMGCADSENGIPEVTLAPPPVPSLEVATESATSVTGSVTDEIEFPDPGAPLNQSPNHIAFYSGKPGSYQLFLMDRNGDNVTPLGGAEIYESFAVWSPGGDRVAYVASAASSAFHELYVKDLGDGTTKQLTDNVGDVMAPVWSPDGAKILFVADTETGRDIFSVDPSGTNLLQLTDSEGDDGAPSWSPDGTRIVFVSERDGNEELYWMEADGGNVVRLTSEEPATDTAPAWSPDGAHIAFVSNRDGDFEIYLMQPDGSEVVQLTENDAAYDWSPTWSPDSSQILFTSTRDSADNTQYQVYIMDGDGENQQRLTDIAASNILPFWWP